MVLAIKRPRGSSPEILLPEPFRPIKSGDKSPHSENPAGGNGGPASLAELVPPYACDRSTLTLRQSSTFSFISSELAFSSGAYIAQALAGKALNLPGISARIR